MVKLIPEARNWWRMFSQWAFIGAGALQGAWLVLDDAQRAALPDNAVNIITGAVVVLGFFGRLIDQPRVRDANKTD